MSQEKKPKFSKQYAYVDSIVESCIRNYRNETEQSIFPAKEHCYEIENELVDRFGEKAETPKTMEEEQD